MSFSNRLFGSIPAMTFKEGVLGGGGLMENRVGYPAVG